MTRCATWFGRSERGDSRLHAMMLGQIARGIARQRRARQGESRAMTSNAIRLCTARSHGARLGLAAPVRALLGTAIQGGPPAMTSKVVRKNGDVRIGAAHRNATTRR